MVEKQLKKTHDVDSGLCMHTHMHTTTQTCIYHTHTKNVKFKYFPNRVSLSSKSHLPKFITLFISIVLKCFGS